MTFLPVVSRELRVSARKRSTFWLRIIAGLIALVLGACFMLVATLAGQGTAGFGGALFRTLTWLALAAAVSAGFFFTADALSEEKREGTLGFLFLTDLRGYDVAGGKLLATSLRGSYALLAFFPILATTLLMGGVTGAEFWKTTAALVNALFVSLGLGLLVSSISRDAQKAMGGTFLLLAVVCALGPVLDAAYSALRHTTYKPWLSLFSPVYVFLCAGTWGRSPFWQSLLLTHLLGWASLACGSWLVKRTWQDRALKTNTFFGNTSPIASPRALRRRSKLLDQDPVLWLSSRERWSALTLLGLALIATVGYGLDVAFSSRTFPIGSQVLWVLTGLLYLWIASLACRFFVEARRGGFLELLLVTPLSVRDAAQGQWRAWKRMFALPVVVLLILGFAARWAAQMRTFGTIAQQSGGHLSQVLVAANSALGAITVGLNVVALVWFGMWMGLRSKNTSLAVLKTIAFVQILPSFGCYFVSMIAVMLLTLTQAFRSGAASGTMPNWIGFAIPLLMTGVASVLSILKDIIFISWARRRLYGCAREQAVLNLAPVRKAIANTQPAPPPANPVPA